MAHEVSNAKRLSAFMAWWSSLLGRAEQSSPKPAGSRRRREGLTAEARAKPIMSRAMDASRVLYSCQTRGSPVVVRSDFAVWQSSDRCDVRGAFDALDPRRSPLSKLCDARRINLYPVGISPNQGPSCNIARAEGLQGRWDPSLGRRLAATPPGGHASTLDWYVPLVSLQDSMH